MLATNESIYPSLVRSKNPRAFRRSLRIGLLSAAFCLAATVPARAQVSGQNVNMVSGTNWTNGDPFLQRQNEPSIAVSSRNSSHLLGGANDYRTVDLPGLLGIDERGDAWLGLFKSFDSGRRWQSTLLPGFPHKYHAEEIPEMSARTGFRCDGQWIDIEWPFAQNLLIAA